MLQIWGFWGAKCSQIWRFGGAKCPQGWRFGGAKSPQLWDGEGSRGQAGAAGSQGWRRRPMGWHRSSLLITLGTSKH